jgi:hypothetical protein
VKIHRFSTNLCHRARGVPKVEKQTQDSFFWNADQSKKICLREIFSVEQFSEEELRRGLEPAVAWSCRMGHLDVKDIVHCI